MYFIVLIIIAGLALVSFGAIVNLDDNGNGDDCVTWCIFKSLFFHLLTD